MATLVKKPAQLGMAVRPPATTTAPRPGAVGAMAKAPPSAVNYKGTFSQQDLARISKQQGVNSNRLQDRIRRAGGTVAGAPAQAAPAPGAAPQTAAPAPQINPADPNSLIKADLAYNRFDQSNPYGSQNVEYDPVTGKTRINTQLSGAQQNILNKSQSNEALAQDAYGQTAGQAWNAQQGQLDFSGLQGVDPQNDATRQRVEQAYMGRMRSQMDPVFQQQSDNLTRDLRARGIQYGSPQWNEQVKQLSDTQNRAFTDASNQAVLSGGTEADRMFGNQSSLRNQGMSEMLTRRAVPLQEAQAWRGMQQGVTNPAFQATGAVDVAGIGANYAGMQNQRDMQSSQLKFTGSENSKDRALQLQLARMSGGSGAMGLADKLAQAQAMQDMDFADWQRRQEYARQFAPKQPSKWDQVLTTGLQAAGQGVGNWIGSLFK